MTDAFAIGDRFLGTKGVSDDGKSGYSLNVTVASGSGTASNKVQGSSSAGAIDAGDPVKVGAVFNVTQPSYGNGFRTDLQADVTGNLKVARIGAVNFAVAQVAVATTATLLAASRPNRSSITIINHGPTVDVYLGGSDVTTGTGVLLSAEKGSSITIPTRAAVYGIAASGTPTISLFESY